MRFLIYHLPTTLNSELYLEFFSHSAGDEPRALSMLNKCSTIELHP
jgi:hypothetical protein